MAKLYLITGPCAVGKSTISKEVAFKSKKSVLIEGDNIYHQVVGGYHSPWHTENHLETFWKVSINIINTYLSDGYNVIFNYIITDIKYQELKNSFKDIDIKFIVLLATPETLLKRDKLRSEEYQMNERCITVLNQFLNYNYDKLNILYTDNLKINEIVNKIIQ